MKFYRSDFSASLVLLLVGLPLSLGIALASHAPISSGLIAALVGALIVPWFSGSKFSVSGPAAGLALVCLQGIQELGSFEVFLFAVMMAGILQIIFSLLRISKFTHLIPNTVIQGLLAAVGLVIVLKQIPHALGWDQDFEGDVGFLHLGQDGNTLTDLVRAVFSAHPGALLLSACSFFVWWLFGSSRLKNFSIFQWIPVPIWIVLVGVLGNMALLAWYPSMALLGQDDHLVMVPIAFDLFSVAHFSLPIIDWVQNTTFWQVAFSIAMIASLESMLTIEAIDLLDPQRNISRKNKELMAQGIGNVLSGSLGGLPIASLIVRSSVNLYAGAKSKYSVIIHGVWLLIAILVLRSSINLIPLCSLAVVLIMVGSRLFRFNLYKTYYRNGITQFLPFLVTVMAILMTDLSVGVLAGTLVGIMITWVTSSYSAISYVEDGQNHFIQFTKDVSGINKLRLKSILSEIPPGSEVCFDGSKAMFVDQDIIDTVTSFQETAKHTGINVEIRWVFGKEFPGLRVMQKRKKQHGFN
jgi:MFS superfamily sulfate permease-like transporter